MTSKTNAANTTKAQPDYSHLPLVPESVLKKRHDLDALKRKRDYAQEQAELAKKTKFQHSARNGGGRLTAAAGSGGGKKEVFYVKKLETFMALAKQRKNNAIRYSRVSKKGMQKRASNKPQMAVREIPMDTNDTTMTTTTTATDEQVKTTKAVMKKQYQCNSVGMNMVFCIRIRDSVGAPDCVRKALSTMRLRKAWDGVFLRYNETTRKTLHLVEPWVVYGKPTRAIVSDLVTRRGYARLEKKEQGNNNNNNTTTAAMIADSDKQQDGDKQDDKKNGKKQKQQKQQQQQQRRSFERVALSDNTVIEQALGDAHGILCVADLVEELYTVGPAFAAVNAFLWPFRLADSKTQFERKTLKLQTNNRDYYGDKGEAINEYIQDML